MNGNPPVQVAVVSATYRRPRQLARLLASLPAEEQALAGVVIVDNGAAVETLTLANQARVPVRVMTPGRNLGCGGGVAVGLREAFRDPAITHAWIFDDDAHALPGALGALLAGLAVGRADAAVPLVVDGAGRVGWFPGPLEQPAWSVIRTPGMTPAWFRERCGTSVLSWAWAPWPSLLVSRRAVDAVGVPRDDYWFQGEDLEWTLRLTARFRGVLVPAAECRHLPPPTPDQPERARLKQAAMLQNNLHTATRLPHGRRLLRHAPGNLLRFLWAERSSLQAVSLAIHAHWFGVVRGSPAGAPGGDGLRRRWESLS